MSFILKIKIMNTLYLTLINIRAAHAYNNDFSILDYLFDEYGLSLKDPKYNFFMI